ncbi:YhgE/Pip family protein [Agromyces mariniharenae]|uniref:YhgE/Pip domain-containing protein n=1 Tax=Agromyces mariniharenae TaxID=2604423 RepID=A0A5S4UY61_9MICO|nr:YhgE/Pip domain-containing protein [Agromyces mariniharenae]TYL50553.1 YhgE/Pip domain-containing protein [Agromyces mariniharenae]
MTRPDASAVLDGPTPGRRRGRRAALIAAVVAVPLAVAGLVAGAIGGADERLDAIPAIVVNNDEFVTITTPDGEEQPVLAGRQLVTELTGDGDTGFDWTISNDEEAAKALADGDAYAVLTIPSDFSASVTSLQGDAPTTAQLDIRTDDAHGYLAGIVGSTVGDAIASTFGTALTTQYLEGLYGNLITVGGSLGDAADGAQQLASGADSLSSGLGQLASGVGASASGASELAGGLDQLAGGVGSAASGAAQAASGAYAYADGVDQYTAGVDGLAGGLGQLAAQTTELGTLGTGIVDYTTGVSDLNTGYGQLEPGLLALIDSNVAATAEAIGQKDATCATEPLPAPLQGLCDLRSGVEGTGDGLSVLATNGPPLAAGGAGLGTLQGGIAQLAGGASQLAGGSAQLRTGADGIASGVDGLAGGLGELESGASGAASGTTELAGGLTQLQSGAQASADGASQLAGGTGELADGLAQGAEGTSSLDDMDAAATADVVAKPVTSESTRDNEITSIGQVVAMLLGPIGLWLGAMALFLIWRPFSREALASTAPTARIVARTLFRASLIGIVQAVAVVLLMHTALGVEWSLLPQTFAFSVLLALSFMAVHAFLHSWLGRAGTIVSLVLVVLQLAASGGLYPLEVVSGPYQAISPFLPLTWAVQGMQLIVSGAGGSGVWAAVGATALFGVLGALGTAFVIARRRAVRSPGRLAVATA